MDDLETPTRQIDHIVIKKKEKKRMIDCNTENSMRKKWSRPDRTNDPYRKQNTEEKKEERKKEKERQNRNNRRRRQWRWKKQEEKERLLKNSTEQERMERTNCEKPTEWRQHTTAEQWNRRRQPEHTTANSRRRRSLLTTTRSDKNINWRATSNDRRSESKAAELVRIIREQTQERYRREKRNT